MVAIAVDNIAECSCCGAVYMLSYQAPKDAEGNSLYICKKCRERMVDEVGFSGDTASSVPRC